ncbi:MAG: hypothetical protein D4S01_07275 [Dehalococcoidia bacterium]|nr:MAG: hypothetical protein D4S01_07275 [Dehalococcoidia bacterium]
MENQILSYSKSCFDKKNIIYMELKKVINIIKTDERIKNLCNKIKKAPNKNVRGDLKKGLPVVIFQGNFEVMKKDGFRNHSQLAVVDIDMYDGIEESLVIKKEVIKNEHVVFCFLSPSGGLKVGCKIPKVETDHEYKEYYLALIEEYQKYSIETDDKTKDISRLCFLAHDPNIYVNYNAKEFTERIILKKNIATNDFKNIKTDAPHIRDALTYIHPEDYEIWTNVCCALKSEKEDYFEIFNKWSSQSEKYKGEEDCRRTWESFDKVKDGIKIATLFYYAKENGYKPKYNFDFNPLDMTVEKQAEDILDKAPMYYDELKKWWGFDNISKTWKFIDETTIIGFVKKSFNLNGLSESKKRAEILNALKDEARFRAPKTLKDTQIQIGKYIYDISNDTKIESTPEIKANIVIERNIENIKPSDQCPFIDNLFEDWLNEDKEICYEVVAFMMSPKYFIDVSFWLVGAGENGKGLFQQIILKTVGYENSTSQDIELLSDPKDRFTKLFLKDKLVCCLGDGNHSTLKETKGLKMLSGCSDPIKGESKGSMLDLTFFNTAKLLGSYNTLPETIDKTNGFYRRQYIIEFKNTFTGKKNPLPNVPEQEYNILAYKCFKRLQKLYKQEKKTLLNWGDLKDRREKYERLSNPIGIFIREKMEKCFGSVFAPHQFIERYSDWALKNGYNQFTNKDIEVRLGNQIGIKQKKHIHITEDGFCYSKVSEIPEEKTYLEGKNWKIYSNYKFKSESETFETKETCFSNRNLDVKKQYKKHVSKVSKVSKNDLLSKIPQKPIDIMDFFEKFAEKTMSYEQFDTWYKKNLEQGEIFEPKPGLIGRL